jgi:hypothetical protein
MTTAKLACPCNRTWFGHSPATQHDDTARRVALRCAQPTMKRPSTVSAASEVVIAQHAEVVIAHCSMDLAWLRHGLGRLEAQGAILVRRVSVYSKCGKPVINASADWEVHELPNVGRNDHTYAHHIATSHGCLQPTVFFFKDRQAAGWSQMKDRVVPLEAMAQLVLSTGFACGFRASNKDYAAFHRAVPEFHMSSYRTSSHNQLAARHSGEVPCTDWADHRMGDESEWLTPDGAEHLGYPTRGMAVDNCTEWRRRTNVRFPSPAGSLRHWLNRTGLPSQQADDILGRPLWQMCFGGSFAARRATIMRWPHALWRWLSGSLARSDNIAESHYTERLWGVLLAPRLSEQQVEALLCATTHVQNRVKMLVGCSCRSHCGKYGRTGVGAEGEAPRALSWSAGDD